MNDEPRPIRVERVHAEVRAAAPLRGEPSAVEPPAIEEAGGASDRPPLTRGDLVPVAAVVVVGLLSGDLAVSLLAASAALAVVGLHRLATVGRFGFGDGFLGFRSENGWPRGVQEDDDFHWTWTSDERRPNRAPPPATR